MMLDDIVCAVSHAVEGATRRQEDKITQALIYSLTFVLEGSITVPVLKSTPKPAPEVP